MCSGVLLWWNGATSVFENRISEINKPSCCLFLRFDFDEAIERIEVNIPSLLIHLPNKVAIVGNKICDFTVELFRQSMTNYQSIFPLIRV